MKKGILQLILLPCLNKHLIKSFNSEIRSKAKDNENWNVWERSSAKEKGSSHLLLPPYPSITLVPLSAHVFIREGGGGHLSLAFPRLIAAKKITAPDAFVLCIGVINRKVVKCQLSSGHQVHIAGGIRLALSSSRDSSSCRVH